jgi:PKHD-type hydroxylase
MERASVGEEGKVSDYRISDIAWIEDNSESKWLFSKIADYAKMANKEMWDFDIWGYHDNLQYTTYYGDGGHYDWHLDLGLGGSNSRKVSITVQLSDPDDYEGGDFQIMKGPRIETLPKSKGTVLLFPSYLLHRVTPVTKGVRKTLVLWVGGYPFI